MRGKSYASVLPGDGVTVSKTIHLDTYDLHAVQDSTCVVLACVRDVNIHSGCEKDGFSNLSIRYVGGLWIWIEFNSRESCMKFKQHTCMMSYFKEVKALMNIWFGLKVLGSLCPCGLQGHESHFEKDCHGVGVRVHEISGWSPTFQMQEEGVWAGWFCWE
ncbi:hypothetical protein L1987_34688 [Smallanthus sonchifolius]|uniref:Uncharacterized protein n=1 Tax=Smallanthus sonchifolius TaxID=185202 RepID=A0ACB9HVY9_9ASTR|nr:hypothetical protein L1987_34688 [Smallanthus sonchifolius]